jgi:nicotinamide mononucleotide transporter
MHITHALYAWWQHQSLLEIMGVITGLLCVGLAALNNIWNWPIAIISVGIYIFIFFDSHLYADMGLQVYFMGMNIYGWYYWSQKPASEDKTPVMRITQQEVIYSLIAVVVFTIFLGSVLKYTPASYPYIDSFCAACSLVAQVFLARKVLENWLIWIFVDIIYVGVYIFKSLDLTAIMYAVYVGLALWGYMDWKKDYRKQLQISDFGSSISEV